jgi:5-methylcytosine-specific restriction endonuclease McrA
MAHEVYTHTARKRFSPKERLAIAVRDDWQCCLCHGRIDPVRDAWILEHKLALASGGDNEPENLGPAHQKCAIDKTKEDLARIAKGKRIAEKHYGARKTKRPMAGSRASKWKRHMDGSTSKR